MDLERNHKRKACDYDSHIESVSTVNGEGQEATQSSYGFVSYFGEAVRRMKANDKRACITREVRKELGLEFKNLPPAEKSKYVSQQHRVDKVAHVEAKFLTRCAPDRFAAIVGQLTDKQREVVCEMGLNNLIKLNCGRLKRKLCCWLVERTDVARCVIELNGSELQISANSFRYIMGVTDGGLPLLLEGDRSHVAAYLEKYNVTSSGINIKTLADILQNSREANEEFKVTFMLFTLCTVLCPPIGVHISSSFLFSLKDTQLINKRNWATFCYNKLIQGITRYKVDHLAYVGGCVLYLEVNFTLFNYREPKILRTSPRSVDNIPRNIEDVESATCALKMIANGMCRRHVARVLFPDTKTSANEGCSNVEGLQCQGHEEDGSPHRCQLQLPNRHNPLVNNSKHVSQQMRGGYISDNEVADALINVDEVNNWDETIDNSLHSSINLFAKVVMGEEPPWMSCNNQWHAADFSKDGIVALSDNSEDDMALQKSWVGYEDDLFEMAVLIKRERSSVDGFVFEQGGSNVMIMKPGQRFKDEFQFRRAVEIQAMQNGIKLCVMENTSTVISCECSDLVCDWKVRATKVRKGNVFVLQEIFPQHTCKKRNCNFSWGTEWSAAKFLHCWVQNPDLDLDTLRYQIERNYGLKYPTWKLEAMDKKVKFWLRKDHMYGYERLHQYKSEMLKLNSQNIVTIQVKALDDPAGPKFDRMFVLFADCSYAFKTTCRRLLIVDGWEIDSPYKAVMLVAVCRDGNDDVLPLAFCEVEEENLHSWSFFLKNLYDGLRIDYMDYGKGICILCDGDNGVDEAVSEFLPYAHYRQCCFSLWKKLMEQFPHAPVYSLFWAACRSTNKDTFENQMNLLRKESKDCHNWLIARKCHSWPLHCMPEWIKSTDITISATEQLRIWLMKYLDMNVANRFAAITQETAKVIEKRYLAGWDWVHDKVTPAARQQLVQNAIEGGGWRVGTGADPNLAVVTMNGISFVVNKHLLVCSCGLWQISGIPCPHACQCINHWAETYDDYVHEFMTVESYRSTYGPGMKELPEILKWEPQIADVIQPPPKRFLEPINVDNKIEQSLTPLLQSDSLSVHSNSSSDGSISL